MRVPTKQIDQECDLHKLTPSSGKFLRAIFRKAKDYYQKFLVNFHDLNVDVTKKRDKGVYGVATVNAVRNQIIDLPFIKVKRQHSSYVFELILIPFIDLKKVENIDPKPKSIGGNGRSRRFIIN